MYYSVYTFLANSIFMLMFSSKALKRSNKNEIRFNVMIKNICLQVKITDILVHVTRAYPYTHDM